MEKKDKKEKKEKTEKTEDKEKHSKKANNKIEVVKENKNKNENEYENKDENDNENKKSIFVSGLPFLATYDEIRNLFEKCGEIISMKVPKFQDSGRNIGYAHIVYSNNESVEKVFKKDFIKNIFIKKGITNEWNIYGK